MPIQGIPFTIVNQTEQHRAFQATGSFLIYNPNDGICFIALDRTASPINFDHRMPSQSGGKFPGPINSYLSVYYQDQSGAGINGQIIIYAIPEALDVPYFWSIGRAIQALSTSLDIVEGSQPPNPAATIDRIWADSQGNIHHLHSDGTDLILADAHMVLGGGLTGNLPNPSLANNSVGTAQIVPGAAANSIGPLGGALTGSLPNPTIPSFESHLTNDIALTAATNQTILFTPILGPVGSIWLIHWKVQIACNAASGVVSGGGLLSPSGAVLDHSTGITYGNNYAGGAASVAYTGVGIYQTVASTDQCQLVAYHTHAGGVAQQRDGAIGSGFSTWTRGIKIG